MRTYNCTISENGQEDYISCFKVKANNLKQAKSYAKIQKTSYFQIVDVRLIKSN